MVKRLPPPSSNPSRRERGAGITLFLLVTGCWTLWLTLTLAYGDAYPSSSLASPADVGGLIAAVPSAMSVVVTGYLLGSKRAALWLGWVPGSLMMAIGFLFSEVPDDLGWLIFIGGLLLMLGWPAYFFPLIAIGAALRRRRVKRPSRGSS